MTNQASNVHLPHVLADCHMCEKQTGTIILSMKAGLGNSCAVCGVFRKGKPYLSHADFKALAPDSVKGDTHDKEKNCV